MQVINVLISVFPHFPHFQFKSLFFGLSQSSTQSSVSHKPASVSVLAEDTDEEDWSTNQMPANLTHGELLADDTVIKTAQPVKWQ